MQRHLGNGIITAKANLVELDLSDNAFGPIGVEGLVGLFRSPSCFTLEILRLNNNGLGIAGGKVSYFWNLFTKRNNFLHIFIAFSPVTSRLLRS